MKRVSVLIIMLAALTFGCENTDLNLPVVETYNVSNITFQSAIVTADVSNQGGSEVIMRGVCWSTSANPTIDKLKSDNGGGIGTFTSAIAQLSSNTTYHVRAYATNADGTSYGSDVTFTTTAK